MTTGRAPYMFVADSAMQQARDLDQAPRLLRGNIEPMTAGGKVQTKGLSNRKDGILTGVCGHFAAQHGGPAQVA